MTRSGSDDDDDDDDVVDPHEKREVQKTKLLQIVCILELGGVCKAKQAHYTCTDMHVLAWLRKKIEICENG